MEGGTCLGPILFQSPKRSFGILFRRIFNLFLGVPTPTGVWEVFMWPSSLGQVEVFPVAPLLSG